VISTAASVPQKLVFSRAASLFYLAHLGFVARNYLLIALKRRLRRSWSRRSNSQGAPLIEFQELTNQTWRPEGGAQRRHAVAAAQRRTAVRKAGMFNSDQTSTTLK
jgi:hypothetical protein